MTIRPARLLGLLLLSLLPLFVRGGSTSTQTPEAAIATGTICGVIPEDAAAPFPSGGGTTGAAMAPSVPPTIVPERFELAFIDLTIARAPRRA